VNKFKTCGNQNGCVTGKISQLKSEFTSHEGRYDGLNSRCKSCHRALYVESKESILAYNTTYYKENRDKRLEYANRPEVNDRRNELRRIRRAKKKATNRVLKELNSIKLDTI